MKPEFPERLDRDVTESAFGKLVERCATEHGWMWCHIRPLKVPGRGGKFITPAATGFPDYILMHPRVNGMLVLELKSRAGTVSAKQKQWLNLLDRVDGVTARVAYPEDWPKVRTYLEAVRGGRVANSEPTV